jgi:hypothetical protein
MVNPRAEEDDMSVAVELAKLRETIAAHHRAPYLLTVGDDGRPHSVQTGWSWNEDELDVSAGNRTLENARARTLVSLVWPPNDVGGYSLIVDGDVTHCDGTGTGDNVVRVRPTRAVLHRPAAAPTAEGCGADCVPILRSS